MEFDKIKSQLKYEINSALEIWSDLLLKFHGDNLAYVYSKGSAIKEWNGPIDYVPVISDIDIQYGILDEAKLFKSENPREDSLRVTLEYENKFIELNPNKIHIPRTQVICVNIFPDQITFVPPLSNSVKMLYGDFPMYPKFKDSDILSIDLKKLEELKPYLDILPDAWLDKVGMDYWSSLRQLNWKVSPSPVRILTHLLPDPLDIWTWNRTRIKFELEKLGLQTIANSYQNYYENGWDLFNSNISDTAAFQNCLISGSKLLEHCYQRYIQYTTNNRKN